MPLPTRTEELSEQQRALGPSAGHGGSADPRSHPHRGQGWEPSRGELPVRPPAREPSSTRAFTRGWISPAPARHYLLFRQERLRRSSDGYPQPSLAIPAQRRPPPPPQTTPGSPPRAQRVKKKKSPAIHNHRFSGITWPLSISYKRPDLIPAADDSHCARRLRAMSGDRVSN